MNMLEELLRLLPTTAGTWSTVIAVTGAAFGLALWVMGSRYNRQLMTLAGVAGGALLGLNLPRLMDWSIAPWAAAVGGTLALGLLAFVLHRRCVAVGLGVVLACWAGWITWLMCKGDSSWTPPIWTEQTTLLSYLRVCWDSIGADVRKVLPFSAGAAFVAGVAVGFVWPRIGFAGLYSIGGATIAVVMGVAAVRFMRPQLIEPAGRSSPQVQSLVFMAAVLVGGLLQYRLAPGARAPVKPKPEEQ